MPKPQVAPYGSWRSPIDAGQIAAGSIRLGEIAADARAVYWIEGRPAEGGRSVIVRRDADGTVRDVNPPPLNARTRVHEYGGGSYLLAADDVIFANFADQRLYRAAADGSGEPAPVTPAGPWRYADLVADAARGRIVCVREDHSGEGEPVNAIVALDPAGETPGQVLVGGNDFYASPRLSPDGRLLAFQTWNHPHMPWESAEVHVAEVRDDGTLAPAEHVAGGPEESTVQPRWSPDGSLYFVCDRSGFWNLYRRAPGGGVECVLETDAEFAGPQWVFGQATYGFIDAGTILCASCRDGLWGLGRLDVGAGRLAPIDAPYTAVDGLHVVGQRAYFLAGGPAEAAGVVEMDLDTSDRQVLRRSSDLQIDAGYIAPPEPLAFPTTGRRTAHGLFYAPANRDFVGPAGEKPPLIVMVHGGPTGAARSALRLGIQYYSSRGIAVLDVNYGGSTGYGRAYRRRLDGQWGVVDVDDCVAGARHLADAGRVDGRRLAITGGSAGGYTVLAALTFRDAFAAGASHYGVSDCEALAAETHKFESRYLDSLIGPYPARRELYVERSPIRHVERLACPVIFFQGLDDKIVPPNQAERMVAALRDKGIPVAYLAFAGEQHGFRQAENIRRAIEAEFYFFSRVLGFAPADDIEPVEIWNL